MLYSTPKSQKDILLSIQHLDSFKKLDREGCILLMKAGKALGHSIAHKALQEITIYKQRNQLQLFWDKQKKKHIVLDPNEQFASIETIKRAQDEAAQSTVKGQRKPHTNKAQTSSREAPTYALESMQFTWQLNAE